MQSGSGSEAKSSRNSLLAIVSSSIVGAGGSFAARCFRQIENGLAIAAFRQVVKSAQSAPTKNLRRRHALGALGKIALPKTSRMVSSFPAHFVPTKLQVVVKELAHLSG